MWRCKRYGFEDAIFNQLFDFEVGGKLGRAGKDLVLLKSIEDNNIIDQILLLAEECKSEVHTYLTFYGD